MANQIPEACLKRNKLYDLLYTEGLCRKQLKELGYVQQDLYELASFLEGMLYFLAPSSRLPVGPGLYMRVEDLRDMAKDWDLSY